MSISKVSNETRLDVIIRELEHALHHSVSDDGEGAGPLLCVSEEWALNILEDIRAEKADLVADRDSWQQQAEDRTKDWKKEHNKLTRINDCIFEWETDLLVDPNDTIRFIKKIVEEKK